MADMEAMDKLRKARIQNFKNVVTGTGKVDHIPHFGNFWSWKYYDAGYKFSEALLDYDKMRDALEQFYGRYSMDVVYENGWRNPIQVTGVLGNKNDYIINDDLYSISIKDQCYMEDDDYDALIADPKKYLWEKLLPNKFSVFKNHNNSVDFRAFFEKYMEFGQKLAEFSELSRQHGIADFCMPRFFGYELLFNILRGMKKLSIDIRRRPEMVLAACQALDETFAYPYLETVYNQPKGSDPELCADLNPLMLGHVILNKKQFEMFYLPNLRKIAKLAEERDKLAFFFIEGSAKRFWEYFQDFPKNRFAILSELDDIREQKQALPNFVMAGGMPADLLGEGTPEQCVAKVKELVEEIGGADHRYIFSEDKMVSFPKDCKRENLLAVCNYLNELRF